MSTQPEPELTPFTDNKLKRTYTGTTLPSIRLRGINKAEKIRELESFINENTKEDVKNGEEFTTEELLTQDDQGQEAKFFYFIGRLNPPHNGHLKALEILVTMANNQNSVPLILLGSGPGSDRTMDNPITFELKQYFITRILNEKIPGSRFKIEKMTNPAKNVSDYIKEGLNENLNTIKTIEIKHIAGGKDEDTTKLLFALKSAEKTASAMGTGAEIIAAVEPIEAKIIEGETPMSATKVRKDAYNAFKLELYGEGSGFDIWREKYGSFYGQDSEEMYNQILYPLVSKSREEQLEKIENYLNPKKRKRGKGGTKRKGRKYRKKTQKRRRRTSRRKF